MVETPSKPAVRACARGRMRKNSRPDPLHTNPHWRRRAPGEGLGVNCGEHQARAVGPMMFPPQEQATQVYWR